MNTIQNWQVFSPVPFREYHPAIVYEGEPPAEVELNKQSGHYDSTNTQHISFYASDYLSGNSVHNSFVVHRTFLSLLCMKS